MSAIDAAPSISAIVPIGPMDRLSGDLIALIKGAGWIREVIIVATRPADSGELDQLGILAPIKSYHWLVSSPGRALQQNSGASLASGDYLWFLHVDSRAIWDPLKLDSRMPSLDRQSAYFFDLGFYGKQMIKMRINEFGVWIRSHIFKMPFGDQALLVPRIAFQKVGGFDVSLAYGEDHILVWRLRQNGFAVRPIGAKILTSARKYDQRGWGRTTWLHLKLTYLQAWPEFWKWVWGK